MSYATGIFYYFCEVYTHETIVFCSFYWDVFFPKQSNKEVICITEYKPTNHLNKQSENLRSYLFDTVALLSIQILKYSPICIYKCIYILLNYLNICKYEYIIIDYNICILPYNIWIYMYV